MDNKPIPEPSFYKTLRITDDWNKKISDKSRRLELLLRESSNDDNSNKITPVPPAKRTSIKPAKRLLGKPAKRSATPTISLLFLLIDPTIIKEATLLAEGTIIDKNRKPLRGTVKNIAV